ncbi:hypothetical protein [Poseidonocella sp. HB161398]|uniref:hypothetical protein n=1 Tax=Poseidonocella sp. HB161398 TaxID=2320855 RepID=UPI001485DC13|nr:hypothetical protein [Poseidonocella sp. HB161398]
MKSILLGAAALVLAAPAFAAPPMPTVPEIDATAGVAAVAALGAGVAMLRERFKR